MSPTVSAIGMALNIEYERPPLGLNLEAHQDTAGNWQIGDGLTSLPDGTRVGPGMSLTPAEYAAASNETLRKFEAGVLRLVSKDVQLNQYQFDALVFLAWNIGLAAFEDSTVLSMVNAERWEDAAYHFGDWVYATVENDFNADGTVRGTAKYGPDGVLLAKGQVWKRAYRGLARRHMAEACLSLGFDWRDACHEDAIELEAVSEKTDYGWRDRVTYKTPWADVLRVAREHPLPAPKMLGEKEAVMGKTLVLPENWDDLTADQQTAWLNNDQTAKLKAKATAGVVVPKKVVVTPKIDPTKEPKAMEQSTTHRGLAKKTAGKEIAIAATGAGGILTWTLPYADKVASFAQGKSPTFIIGCFVTLAALIAIYGVWRIISGEKIAEYGRENAEEPKV
ncbi:MAG: putative endolysin [Prokaryotic dsDNA virus sp.]|nr:MAG: putative endolysin [Prokaryotic dsDNA virus sp.]|tara:strand:+ start:40958 stop:42136 length:1179 start_codon:yes stop_codon:yes gene_type:complete